MGYFLNSYVYTGNQFANGFWLKAALILAPAAVIGDLFESWLKRKMHVKDTGNIMPGHGGVLDRFDAMLFAIPAFYILLYLCDI
jgi:phosphatidate cytidylyltransferase